LDMSQLETINQQLAVKRQGLLFVLSGITGHENNTVLDGLQKTQTGMYVSPIITTRNRRLGEKQGEPHTFVSADLFMHLKDEGVLLSYCENKERKAWYGHMQDPIKRSLRAGIDVIMDAGPEEAAMLVTERKLKPVLIHLIPPRYVRSEEEHNRWNERIKRIKDEYQIEYQYTIRYEPDRLSTAVDELKSIILDEHMKAEKEQMNSEKFGDQLSQESAEEEQELSGIVQG
jgi:guanylate kinase